jgi:SAM-dependent methyltransferase
LTYLQAIKAVREWHRILKPNGQLFLELPDLDRCIAILGKYKDPKGYDMGMIGLFGHPPMVESDGLFQLHKWAWSFPALKELLTQVGFTTIKKLPTTQKWRLAYKMNTDRDIRVKAVKK